MSLSYTGGPYSGVISATYASAIALGAALSVSLQGVGWSLIDSGADFWRLRSPVTAQGTQIQVVFMQNTLNFLDICMERPNVGAAGKSLIQQPGMGVYPQAGHATLDWSSAVTVWDIVCSPSFVYVYAPASATATRRRFYFCHCIHLEDSDVARAAGVAAVSGSNNNNVNNTIADSFRTRLAATNSAYLVMWSGASSQGSQNNVAGNAQNCLQFVTRHSAQLNDANSSGYRWFDDSIEGPSESLIACGMLVPNQAQQAFNSQIGKLYVLGDLWDASIWCGPIPAGTTWVRDGVTWLAITDNNSGAAGTSALGTLAVRVG